MTTKTISAREAANRTRRAMALRDLMLEVGWDVAKITAEGDTGWKALARTIEKRDGRPFRDPSAETRDQALGLLSGALTVSQVPVAVPAAPPRRVTQRVELDGNSAARLVPIPQPEPVSAAPASAGAPSPRPELGSAGPTGTGDLGIGRNGLRRVPTNITLLCD
jgi:hypothetical protein